MSEHAWTVKVEMIEEGRFIVMCGAGCTFSCDNEELAVEWAKEHESHGH